MVIFLLSSSEGRVCFGQVFVAALHLLLLVSCHCDLVVKQHQKVALCNTCYSHISAHNHLSHGIVLYLQEPGDLKDLIMKVIREGLEGLVLKDVNVSIGSKSG